jgi:hypothetical protein
MAAAKKPQATPEALDPLERHAQLVAELEHIEELADADGVEFAELRAAELPAASNVGQLTPQATEKALAQARVDVIRGKDGAQAEVDRLTAKRAEVEAHIRELADRAAARHAARAAVLKDIEALVHDELPAFMAEARRLSEVAHEALGELTRDDRLTHAHETWEEARGYWRRLARTHTGTLARDFVKVSEPPPCPMPRVADVLAVECLPSEVTIADAAGDELGTVIDFEDRNGATVKAPAGSREAANLDASEHYRRV